MIKTILKLLIAAVFLYVFFVVEDISAAFLFLAGAIAIWFGISLGKKLLSFAAVGMLAFAVFKFILPLL